MKKAVIFLGCCLLGWGASNLFAQQATVAAGGDANGAGGTVSYSIGQIDYLSASGSGGSINQGVQQPDAMRTISGTLRYDNGAGTLLNNCTVQLKQGNTVAYQTQTDAAGMFQFVNPVPGSYVLNGVSTKPWGSVNATDALLILKQFTGSVSLTPLRAAAADVNGNGFVNSSDALQAMKRFVGLQSSFAAGDWAFENPGVDFTGSANVVNDFMGICYGDVDGSYLPPSIKQEPTIFLQNQGLQMIDNNQIVQVPVRSLQNMECAAISLVMNFPESDLEVLGVEAAYDNQGLVYNTIGNQLRIAWCTLYPKSVNANDVLLTLSLKLKNYSSSTDLGFELNEESTLANFKGEKQMNKTLAMPILVNSKNGIYLGQNIPNPFKDVTEITYTLPEDGYVTIEVLDVLGQQISVLADQQEIAGSHNVTFSGNVLPNGVYFYKMTVNTGDQKYSQTKRMIISR